MNKILNWICGSFFRTLGRILVYILLGLLLSYLLKDIKLPSLFNVLMPLNVYADSDTIKIYNTTLTSSNYVVVPSGSSRVINISGGTVYGQNGNGEYPPEYYIGTFCTDSGKITSWEGTSMGSNGGAGSTYSNTLSQINFFNTEYSCMFPNSTYTGGHIVYLYGKISPIWNTNATSATLLGRITYNQQASASWSLLNWSWSNEPIDIDYSSNTIISQNSTIISQNNQIIQGQQNIISSNNSNTNSIINNQNSNKNDIINNNNTNTNSIINNQNENTQQQIDSQKVCSFIDKNNIIEKGYLNASGTIISATEWGVTDFIPLDSNSSLKILTTRNGTGSFCFYNANKIKISCVFQGSFSDNDIITIPSDTSYARFNIFSTNNKPTYQLCKNGNQAMQDSLNDSNTSEATSEASNFFANFTTNQHGLTGIITAPLSAIQSLTNKTCSPLILPLPFVNQNLELPCMRTIYDTHFGSFMQLYDIITLGIISYWVMVRIFGLVKDFKNPEHDEIEVVDL